MKHSVFKLISFSKFTFIAAFCIVICIQPASAYVCKYKEDYYNLFHVHYQQLPEDCLENIYWLEQAVKSDFCNPQYALAKIENEKQWEKYRCLFQMHLNLKLIEQYMRLGRIYDKKVAYFYDAPWKQEYLDDLNKTLECYKTGYYYWQEAKLWAEKANISDFAFLYITDLQNWEDERERICTGTLDYKKILDRETTRVQKVIDTFVAMDDKTY